MSELKLRLSIQAIIAYIARQAYSLLSLIPDSTTVCRQPTSLEECFNDHSEGMEYKQLSCEFSPFHILGPEGIPISHVSLTYNHRGLNKY